MCNEKREGDCDMASVSETETDGVCEREVRM